MTKYSEPIMKKRFSGETLKEAKLKALKWIGKYVMCKDELKDVSYTFDSDTSDKQFPSVTVTIFALIDEKEVKEKHCKVCKEFHKLFFINENCNCEECKAMAFSNRMSEMISVKKGFYKEQLKKILSSKEEGD